MINLIKYIVDVAVAVAVSLLSVLPAHYITISGYDYSNTSVGIGDKYLQYASCGWVKHPLGS